MHAVHTYLFNYQLLTYHGIIIGKKTTIHVARYLRTVTVFTISGCQFSLCIYTHVYIDKKQYSIRILNIRLHKVFSKSSLTINFTIMTFIVHQCFYTFLIALLFLCANYISCHNVSIVIICLSVCMFSLGKKLTRQEDQKLFLNFV